MPDVSSITIQEISGTAARQVVLTGAGLPHKGTKWSSKQVIKTSWFVGNARASQQVLGPQEPSTTMSGKWSVVQLASCPVQLTQENTNFLVVRPDVIMEFFEEMLAGGALLQVTWAAQAVGGNDVQIVRVGRLESVDWSPETIHDVPWEITFAWVGRTGTTGQSVVSTRDDNTADATSLNSALNAAQSTLTALNFNTGSSPPDVTVLSLGDLESLATSPFTAVNTFIANVQASITNIQQVGAIAASTTDQPFATANLYVEFSNLTVVQTNASLDQLSAIPPDLMTSNSDALSVILAMGTFGQAWDAMLTLGGAAKDMELKSRAQVSSNPGGAKPSVLAASFLAGAAPLAIHTCREGDTPVSLSVRYYNSPDLVAEILKANSLPWWTVVLTPGQVLTIPPAPRHKAA